MIICRTPFRLSFFGGGTDYPAWYRAHGGEVVATARPEGGLAVEVDLPAGPAGAAGAPSAGTVQHATTT